MKGDPWTVGVRYSSDCRTLTSGHGEIHRFRMCNPSPSSSSSGRAKCQSGRSGDWIYQNHLSLATKIAKIGCVESTICGAKNNRVFGPKNIHYYVRTVTNNQCEIVGQRLVKSISCSPSRQSTESGEAAQKLYRGGLPWQYSHECRTPSSVLMKGADYNYRAPITIRGSEIGSRIGVDLSKHIGLAEHGPSHVRVDVSLYGGARGEDRVLTRRKRFKMGIDRKKLAWQRLALPLKRIRNIVVGELVTAPKLGRLVR
jgi:hypothetical protein